jgi:hypothetical protein
VAAVQAQLTVRLPGAGGDHGHKQLPVLRWPRSLNSWSMRARQHAFPDTPKLPARESRIIRLATLLRFGLGKLLGAHADSPPLSLSLPCRSLRLQIRRFNCRGPRPIPALSELDGVVLVGVPVPWAVFAWRSPLVVDLGPTTRRRGLSSREPHEEPMKALAQSELGGRCRRSQQRWLPRTAASQGQDDLPPCR